MPKYISAYYTSAAICETFDIAIRAIGGINGQKYLFPYTGNFNNSLDNNEKKFYNNDKEFERRIL